MIGVGLSVGLGGAPQSGAPAAPNPNLLLWSEQFQQAVWAKMSATVDADVALNPAGTETTADRISLTGLGSIIQLSATGATTGATVTHNVTLTGGFERYDLSGTFDGAVYAASVYIREEGATGFTVRLQLLRSGGFIALRFVDTGDEPVFLAWGAKLETPSLTAYVKREGT